ncbi:hypothetical protein, partial [Saccharopolyspora sp. NPDC002686]|uniref:hypothetical protein n=1 Tax=Saccharopolyspora sp. NPDC002686 TaxID=3154541 RepID=UPI0033177EC1
MLRDELHGQLRRFTALLAIASRSCVHIRRTHPLQRVAVLDQVRLRVVLRREVQARARRALRRKRQLPARPARRASTRAQRNARALASDP